MGETKGKGERYKICRLDEIEPVKCPCGNSRRAFTDDPDQIASIHLVNTAGEGKLHYHKKLTEIYLILEGEGYMELDGERYDVSPGSTVLIKPGCRHRAVGTLKFVNMPVPAFDPNDDWFD
jgi:mannose-6-phosphate isomerase-like protein (cupin superfamily)